MSSAHAAAAVTTADVLVLGVGGVGSSALLHLAQAGVKAIGLDRFPPGHDRGSSHGDTRIIRQAYFEHADYVPLSLRSYALWADLEARCREKLFFQTGLLQIGPPEGHVIAGVFGSARQHGLDVERLEPASIRRRYPGYAVSDDQCGAFEHKAGYLRVEACVRAHAAAAQQLGAEIVSDVTVLGWQPTATGVTVQTSRGEYSAAKLIITAGAWAPELLGPLWQARGIQMQVRRKPLFWFAPQSPVYRSVGGAPAFLYELPTGVFYGFPQVDDQGVKVAEHSGGDPVADPLTVDRSLHPADEARVAEFCRDWLPQVTPRVTRHSVCLYTMSPDENFLVDRHPEYPQVAFAAGLSGHGFKFTSALGEALAELVLTGRTQSPIGFLRLSRLKG